MTEMFDVIDENDNVIGQASREECHKKQLLHRGVHVLILNSKGELYIQKRSQKMDTNPGLWTSSASGHVDCGESYKEAAKREMGEEIGIKSELNEIGKAHVHDPKHNHIITVFSGNSNGPFKTKNAEIEKAEFVKIEKIKADMKLEKRKFTPAFLEAFRKFCEVRGIWYL